MYGVILQQNVPPYLTVHDTTLYCLNLYRYGVPILRLWYTNGAYVPILQSIIAVKFHIGGRNTCARTYTTDLISLIAKVARCVGLGLGVYDFLLLDPAADVTFTLLGVFELE